MAPSVDLTKVNLEPKALMWLTVAFTAVLIVYGVAQFGAGKVREAMKGMTKGLAEKSEEAF